MSIKSPHNSCSMSLIVFTRFSFKRPHWNQYMPKFTFLKPFHILSNLVIQICTLVNSNWVHQSCAAQNNYSDPVFGVREIVLFKFCHLYLGTDIRNRHRKYIYLPTILCNEKSIDVVWVAETQKNLRPLWYPRHFLSDYLRLGTY